MHINSRRRPVTGRACNILNLRIFRPESAKHSGAKKFIQIECIQTGALRDGGPDQWDCYTSYIRARHSEYEIVFMRALYAWLRIYLSSYRSRVQLRPSFPGFLENPAKTIACGRHGGLFKRPLAISINGARTILDLPTCWRSERDCALLPAVIKKVSRSNSQTRDWHAPAFLLQTDFFFFLF